MPDPTTRTIELDDLTVAYDRAGDGGVPLVLVHGFTGARTDFSFVHGPLAEERMVLAADQRGHRDTSNPEDPLTYTFDQLVADLVGVLDILRSTLRTDHIRTRLWD